MIQITERLAKLGTSPRPGTKLRAFRGITIHDTGNPSATANAEAHANLLLGSWANKPEPVSWHYCVDDHSIFRSIPEDEVSWHASDGTYGPGNNETISMETCVNAGGDYDATMRHAADLCADILRRRGITQAKAYLFQHYDFAPDKKNCPAYIRAKGLWPYFVAMVQERLSAASGPSGNGGGVNMYQTHQIVRGDTLWALARAYGTTVDAIKAANPGVNPDALTIGSTLNIPSQSPDVMALQGRVADLEKANAELLSTTRLDKAEIARLNQILNEITVSLDRR